MDIFAMRASAIFSAIFALAAVAALAGCRLVDYRSQRYDYGSVAVHRYEPGRSMSAENMEKLWRQEAGGLIFTFNPYPKYPAPDEEITLELGVMRREAGRETSVTGASVAVNAHMTSTLDHVDFSQTCAQFEEAASGRYRVCMAFSAGGDWEVDFKVTMDGRDAAVHFPFKVRTRAVRNVNEARDLK